MSDRLNILFVAPEVAPFARSGQLADVTGSLPKALKEMGHDVRVITPQYRVTNERRYVLRDVIRLHDIQVSLSGEPVQFHVKSAFLPHTKVQVYFLNYRPYFFREGLYADIETGVAYEDNDRRYELLALGALETLRRLRWQPDVIHCHGWPSAFVPYYLKTQFKDDAFFSETRTLFSLHDGLRTGPLAEAAVKRLNEEADGGPVFTQEPAALLELGLRYSDGAHVAVSPAHPELAAAAEKQAAKYNVPVSRIENGFDGCRWNPESDPFLKNRFSAENMDGKAECRRRLLNEFGISRDEALSASVLTLWAQRGEDLSAALAQASVLTQAGWTLLVYAEDRGAETAVAAAGLEKNSAVISVKTPDEASLHRVIAGSDSVWLNSVEALDYHLHQVVLRYGAKPFVGFPVKGLTVAPTSEKLENPGALVLSAAKTVKALKSFVETVNERDAWSVVAGAEMQLGHSWLDAVSAYEALYCEGND